ncbi:YfgG family protein [Biostraticola tofi]
MSSPSGLQSAQLRDITPHSQAWLKLNIFKHKRRTSLRMTRWILLISFIILFGRLIFASISAWHHHQSKQTPYSTENKQPDTAAPESDNRAD